MSLSELFSGPSNLWELGYGGDGVAFETLLVVTKLLRLL
jgi:hypothetical protein